MKSLCQKKINNENCWVAECSKFPGIEVLTADTLNLREEEDKIIRYFGKHTIKLLVLNYVPFFSRLNVSHLIIMCKYSVFCKSNN